MQVNHLEVFKERAPHMAEFAGHEKILFHRWCIGSKVAYGIEQVNGIFLSSRNRSNLKQRALALIEGLQSRHIGLYARYPHANEEYPVLYQRLVAGLSDEALNVIRQLDASLGTNEPPDLGQTFVQRLLDDKYEWGLKSASPRILVHYEELAAG